MKRGLGGQRGGHEGGHEGGYAELPCVLPLAVHLDLGHLPDVLIDKSEMRKSVFVIGLSLKSHWLLDQTRLHKKGSWHVSF